MGGAESPHPGPLPEGEREHTPAVIPTPPYHSRPPFCHFRPPFCHSCPSFCHSCPSFCHSRESGNPEKSLETLDSRYGRIEGPVARLDMRKWVVLIGSTLPSASSPPNGGLPGADGAWQKGKDDGFPLKTAGMTRGGRRDWVGQGQSFLVLTTRTQSVCFVPLAREERFGA